MGDFGIKAWLRLQLVMAGINFNDLKPKPGGSGSENRTKAHAESLMFRRGISVEDLKEGTVYKDPNYVFVERKNDTEADIEKKKEAAAAYEKEWKAMHENPFDKDGNMTESAIKLSLQYETERLYYSSMIKDDDDDDDDDDDEEEEEEDEEEDEEEEEEEKDSDIYGFRIMDVAYARMRAAYQKDNNFRGSSY